MSIALHPKKWWIFACEKMRKKKWNRFLLSNAFNVYMQFESLEYFVIQKLDTVLLDTNHYEYLIILTQKSCVKFLV